MPYQSCNVSRHIKAKSICRDSLPIANKMGLLVRHFTGKSANYRIAAEFCGPLESLKRSAANNSEEAHDFATRSATTLLLSTPPMDMEREDMGESSLMILFAAGAGFDRK